METQDLIDLFRKQVQDVAEPFLWDQTEVLQYLGDAQDMFVRLTGGISDNSTRTITDINVVEDQPTSKHSKLILRIRSAKLITAKVDLELISEADVGLKMVKDYGWMPGTFLDDDDTGTVIAAVIGMEDYKLRWYKVPDTDDVCRLHVYRLPIVRIEDEECQLEIEEQHHIHLLKWMKHMAYSKEDAETYDKDLADRTEQAFYKYCGVPEGVNAKGELERRRYKPRNIHYGGL